MFKQLTDECQKTIFQLVNIAESITDEQYTIKLNLFSGSSLGGHYRHVIEFYTCCLNGYNNGTVNYDNRQRDKQIEENRLFAIEALYKIATQLSYINATFDTTIAKQFTFEACFGNTNDVSTIQTTFERELAYNIEHAVHHIAIIKIGIKSAFPNVEIPNKYGVASSTLRANANS